MKSSATIHAFTTLFMIAAISILTSCSNNGQDEKIKSLQAELDKYKADEALQDHRLAVFDSLDFEFYSNQKWTCLTIVMPIISKCIILMAVSQPAYTLST
jgi:hypothetical protein